MITFRLHINSPKSLASDDIQEWFPGANITGISIAQLHKHLVATVSFKEVPEILKGIKDEDEKSLNEILQRQDVSGYIDCHFFGFTPLRSPQDAVAE